MGFGKGAVIGGIALSGTLAGMGVDPPIQSLEDVGTRPCDFCGHSVAADSLDEYDCRACGDPFEASARGVTQAEWTDRGS